MKMQNQNTNLVTSPAAGTQKPVIPKVRYHPSIQTNPTPGDGARPKTRTGQTQKSRPAAARPPLTGTKIKAVQENQDAHKNPNPVPAVRPRPQKPVKKPNQGRVQRTAADPDPPQTPHPVSDRAPPRPEQVPRKPVKKPNQGPVQRADADPDPQQPDQLPDGAPPTPEQVPLGLGAQVDQSIVEMVEVLTRGQSTNQDWFTWRKNRITASVAHCIAHCRFVHGKSKTPPTSYLAAVTGEGRHVQTRAMRWGVNMEAKVVQRYQTLKSAALGRSVLVQDCGLFIDAQRPWLAASPDGIVMDSQTGQWLLCLEVKCPYKHRDRRVEDACRDDPAFCLEIQDQDGRRPGRSPVYRLKTSHSYYTQIQCQLAVTGLRKADLVVFTREETAIVPVTFDPDLWEETVSNLQVFYRDAVLPHLREKTGQKQDTAAAWTPET